MMSRWSYVQRASFVTWVIFRTLFSVLFARIMKRKTIPGPERLRLMLEELSGSFLKFGQILSLQVDTLPREYCDALLNLLDRVPPFPRDQVREVFIRDRGKPPEEIYLEFDYTPLAAASIGQVHRARLADSTPVAVKVQRPGIEAVFMRDAALLRGFVKVALFLKISSLYFMRDLIGEFNYWLLDELDYHREASYAEVLERNARETPTEKVPRIYWELTGTRILTMDFLQGYSVTEYLRLRDRKDLHRLEELNQIGFDPSKFVSNVINNFLSDAFRFGVYHADLHPANLLIMKDNVVGYVDFGIVGRMTSPT
jgi:ubiquinone biosynthesis protein